MIYIVSGFMRCGTSMMMKALEAGGLEAAYSKGRDERMNKRWGGPEAYHPNESYYELEASDYRRTDFPHAYEGKLLKCLWGGMLHIAPCQARVVFMRRPTGEIFKSMVASFGNPGKAVDEQEFEATMDRVVSILRDRRSFISVNEVSYGEVLDSPLKVFEGLQRDGWPIDPKKAAEIPDGTKKRHRG